jgi:thiol-disulfide isomerase/thioredoxin
MNKRLLISIVSIIIIVGGALAYAFVTRKTNTASESVGQTTDTQNQSTTPPPSEPTPQPQSTPGAYIDYSESALASAKGTRLLFFYAPWCPQCRQVDASIKADGVPSDVTVLKVDYDSNQSLRQQYGVTIQTTFVKLDASGTKVASYVAYDEPTFSSVRRELLP